MSTLQGVTQTEPGDEAHLKSKGIYIEPYAQGFIIADYSHHRARYRGRSNDWKQQPLIPDPFLSKGEAIKIAREEPQPRVDSGDGSAED